VRLKDDASPGVSPNVDISSATATALADRRVRIQAVVKVSSATLLFLPYLRQRDHYHHPQVYVCCVVRCRICPLRIDLTRGCGKRRAPVPLLR
jgi:hypothetical protein